MRWLNLNDDDKRWKKCYRVNYDKRATRDCIVRHHEWLAARQAEVKIIFNSRLYFMRWDWNVGERFRLFIYRHWWCLSANKTSNEIHSPNMIDWAMSAHMDRSRHSESQQKLFRNSSKAETRCFKIRIRKLMAHKKRNEGGTFFLYLRQ